MLFTGRKKKRGKDSTFSSEELLNDQSPVQNEEEEIETALSISPNWVFPAEKEYVYRFLNNELAPLKPNQISVAGIDLEIDEDGTHIVTAFIRSSLNKAIKFEKVAMILLGTEEKVLARKTFDLSELGELPARSSRPWQFSFHPSDMVSDAIPADGWKLAFEIKKEHKLDLAESWEQSLPEDEKEKLKQLLTKIKPPAQGEVNFMGLKVKKADNGDLHVTLLIRNGSEKNINIEALPLVVEDASGEVIAKGGFKLEGFEVKANTSKPWTFIFPSTLVTKDEPDLTTWKVYPAK